MPNDPNPILPGSLERLRGALALALTQALRRIDRRAAAIGQDLARGEEADQLSREAQWLVAEAARAPRGARSIAVMDWSSGEPRRIELALEPGKTAREQVEALFKRARRMKRGAVIARERLTETLARRVALARLADALGAAEHEEALEVIAERARRAAPGDFTAPHVNPQGEIRPTRQPRRLAYRSFRGAGDARILVGRGGADNDELTLHVARPHDWWLHVRGRPGAHVVVPLDKGHTCPPDLLADAAHLAAHFSDARGEPLVEIEHTPRRHVRKPRHSPPGLVVIAREKVLTLRLDSARLALLIASETTSEEPT